VTNDFGEEEDGQELHDALKELGFDLPVEEELRAFTASVGGGASL